MATGNCEPHMPSEPLAVAAIEDILLNIKHYIH